ncbi:MAG: hypothetical protein JEZ06_16380 [Anaerolineaceae bacterium]|nr:hypothetical protein [Anaerolineaceae bacterium]
MVEQNLEEREEFSGFLRGIIKNHKTISFIGLERGCGKTSSFKSFLASSKDQILGISSIGTDHSASHDNPEDNGLVYIPQNTLVATARQTLSLCDPTKEILETTGVETPMGEVVLFKALSAGYVFLAGPSILADSIQIKQALFNAGAQSVMLDGAADRKSPALPQLSDGVVLTTNLFSDQIEHTAEKIIHDVEILTLEALENRGLADICRKQILCPEPYFLIDENLNVHCPQSEEEKANLLYFIAHFDKKIRAIGLKGALTNSRLAPLLKAETNILKKIQQVPLVIEDPTKCFISSINRNVFMKNNLLLRVINPVNLLALCINPSQTGLNKSQLTRVLMDFSRHFKLPVMDVRGGVYVEGF